MELGSAGAGPETSSLISESVTPSTAHDTGEWLSSGWLAVLKGVDLSSPGFCSGCCCKGQNLFFP